MKLKKLNPFALDDRLIEFVEKQDFNQKEKTFFIKWLPKAFDFIFNIGRFIILYYVFSKAYNVLEDKFFVLVFTFIVVYFLRKPKKV